MDSSPRLARLVHRRLLRFYGEPVWRRPLPPLDELVSTILSQNTNDLNRDRAFDALRTRFPTWEAVRDAAPEDMIAAIRPAGLANQKAPRIQAVLQAITAERGRLDLEFLRRLPGEEARDWLLRFKGVGPKTAAVGLLCWLGDRGFPVDTHIHRVSGRLGLRPERMSADAAHGHLARLFPPDAYRAAHLNLIRLGREICHPRNPACDRCPLADRCAYALRRTGPARADPRRKGGGRTAPFGGNLGRRRDHG